MLIASCIPPGNISRLHRPERSKRHYIGRYRQFVVLRQLTHWDGTFTPKMQIEADPHCLEPLLRTLPELS